MFAMVSVAEVTPGESDLESDVRFNAEYIDAAHVEIEDDRISISLTEADCGINSSNKTFKTNQQMMAEQLTDEKNSSNPVSMLVYEKVEASASEWMRNHSTEEAGKDEELKQALMFKAEDGSSNVANNYSSSVGHNTKPYRINVYIPLSRHSSTLLRSDSTVGHNATHMTVVHKSLEEQWKERGDDVLLVVISAFYAKLLVVMGLAFPMTEVISNDVPSFSYLGFYMYLYFGSILYFIFVFVTMLKKRASKGNRYIGFGRIKSPKEVADFSEDGLEQLRGLLRASTASQHYGSFYLRIGAVAFGVGSMIYSGLEFAQYFETDPGSKCHNILMAVTPATRMIFTFIQMYFIFLNAKMAIYCKPKAIAYFGLMHMLATNLCVWFNVIIEETKQEILHYQETASIRLKSKSVETSFNQSVIGTMKMKRHANPMFDYGSVDGIDSSISLEEILNSGSLEDECKRSNMMGDVVQDASQFLFPCAIEYSLICAAIIYVMWRSVSSNDNDGANYQRSNIFNGSAVGRRSRHQYSVDCAKANKGLFGGIFVLVATIVSLILFFALINNPNYQYVAILEVGVVRFLLICSALIATLVGIFQIRELGFDSSRHFGLAAVLLVVAQIGLMAYQIFTVIACCFTVKKDEDEDSTFVLSSAIVALLQAIAQTLFILDASRRHTYTADQQSRKPGREVVTFLLMCNFVMWAVNTLEKSKADVNPLQLEFFGLWPWIIIMNVSMPLTIFYRFHSTVFLCEIWKRCYKGNKVKTDFL